MSDKIDGCIAGAQEFTADKEIGAIRRQGIHFRIFHTPQAAVERDPLFCRQIPARQIGGRQTTGLIELTTHVECIAHHR